MIVNILKSRWYGLYSHLYPTFGRHIELVGRSRLRIHPSTSLVMVHSKITIDNGVLRLGLDWPGLGIPQGAGLCYDLKRDNCRVHLYNSVLHTIGDVLLFPGCGVLAINAEVVIRDGTCIAGSSLFMVRKKLHIGERCLFARGVTVMDSDWHPIGVSGQQPTREDKEVMIGDHCWIGQNAIILKGVTIGEGAVVAAGSVVADNVKERTMVAGIPARVVKENVTWQE